MPKPSYYLSIISLNIASILTEIQNPGPVLPLLRSFSRKSGGSFCGECGRERQWARSACTVGEGGGWENSKTAAWAGPNIGAGMGVRGGVRHFGGDDLRGERLEK